MSADVIQFVPRANPNRPQPESLLAQAASLVGFIKPKKPEPKWVPFAPMIWDDCEMRMVPDPKYAHPFY